MSHWLFITFIWCCSVKTHTYIHRDEKVINKCVKGIDFITSTTHIDLHWLHLIHNQVSTLP